METITNYVELCTRISSVPRPVIVGVEGFTGSGKSYLADRLAKDVSASVIHTDEYVTDGDASLPYLERLTCGRILSAVNSAIASSPFTIVEGICLREVLRRSNIAATLFVYVKSVAANGLWDDGFHLEDFTEGAMSVKLEEPHRSDFTYHAAVRPHERADIVFHRLEAEDEA